ncbi:NAD(P)-binding protein [Punctularia strigosozonata HHB-11173 SS5]|uniref:NAD(P)-binding protein n=1 Tax=Punctularia strigosozonata (strain HHB-11173) TaxID=741275 RepID=R7S4Y1_PUNST|nr:NAD(P)-binding protein [Punctularia strigosozonata HHB-11173 SS5]EIN04882.1 NAD(P)-binding protein [Punctularia strigosozonata HHB-11173 SS5]
MATNLQGKRVVVVGGSSGIGFAAAKLALVNGASVIISSSNQAKVDAATKRLSEFNPGGREVEGRVCDVKGGESAIKAFFDALPEFDHLIWTAGDPLRIGYPDIDLAQTQDAFAVRALGPIYAGKYAPSHMPKSSKSSITLTIGSVVRKPRKGWALIAAIAGSVERFTKGLAVELAPIRVNVVSPGLVKTEMWDSTPAEQLNAIVSGAEKTLLVQHVADADEVAEAYLYLLKCGYVTGETLNVDGGGVLA